jgi:hypothetical protein
VIRLARVQGADGKVVQSEGTYSNLQDELLAVVGGLNSVENGRELVTLELHCSRRNIKSENIQES